MNKAKAIELFGSVDAAATEIGCSTQAVNKWPDALPRRICDRVISAFARKCFREGRRSDFWTLVGKASVATNTKKATPHG